MSFVFLRVMGFTPTPGHDLEPTFEKSRDKVSTRSSENLTGTLRQIGGVDDKVVEYLVIVRRPRVAAVFLGRSSGQNAGQYLMRFIERRDL